MEKENLVKHIIDRAGAIILRNEVQLGLPTGYLKTQVALHLPRFSLKELVINNKVNEELINSECRRLGEKIKLKISSLPEELTKNVTDNREETILLHKNGNIFEIKPGGREQEVIFSLVNPSIGELIQTKLHYLSNYRTDTVYHYGLFRKGEKYPFSYLAISYLDRKYILNVIPFKTDFKDIMVVTRLYNINNSPRNSASLLLSLARRDIKSKHRNVKALVTSVNPNVLFIGSSFKSAAYEFFALMPFEPLYYNDSYMTRKTVKRFKLSPDKIKEITGRKLKCLPIILTINFLDSKLLSKINQVKIKKISKELYNKG